jgi:hypothetical protein
MLLHAGPPIEWRRMCGPMQGAIIGAILHEEWARSEKEARALCCERQSALRPCHHHDAVGPMSGIISPSMPVWIVRNSTHGNRAYSNLNEGLGKVLRFGANNCRSARPPEMDARLARADARRRAEGARPARAEAVDGAGAAHGRRSA